MKTTYLQLFLLFDVFFMGALATTAIRHAYAHFKPPAPEPEKPKLRAVAMQNGHLPTALREQLLETAQENFEVVLERAARELQKDLETTTIHINKQVERMGSETVSKQIENYLTRIAELQKRSEELMVGTNQELTKYHDELKQKMVEEVAVEKQVILKQLDTKLADAVQSFLIETLQHNVDLGAQSAYLTKMLDEHKSELVKGIADEN